MWKWMKRGQDGFSEEKELIPIRRRCWLLFLVLNQMRNLLLKRTSDAKVLCLTLQRVGRSFLRSSPPFLCGSSGATGNCCRKSAA